MKCITDKRKQGVLKYDIIDISLQDISIEDKENYIKTVIKNKSGYDLHQDLKTLCMDHYRAFSVSIFSDFIETWFKPKCTNIVLLYTTRNHHEDLPQNMVICGIAMYRLQPAKNRVFIRILCSKMFCGRYLIEHILATYTEHPLYHTLYLYAEYDAISFYRKHGYVIVDRYIIDIYGIRYPMMVYQMKGVMRENVVEHFWPGISYYLWQYWYVFVLVFVIIFLFDTHSM